MSGALAPRPGPRPEEVAVVVAAYELVRQVDVVPPADPASSWRFSGRWFNAGRFTLRRPLRP
ncbi:MAG: hypothetical protein ACP5PB_00425 [Acidimicrobiales bacterium]